MFNLAHDRYHGKRRLVGGTLPKKRLWKKILLAMDAMNLNTNVIDFGCYIARLTHSRLTGIFLEVG